MTIKEMEEKVDKAKKLQRDIDQLKKLSGIVYPGSISVSIGLKRGGAYHETIFSSDNQVITDLRESLEREIKVKENRLKKLEGESEEKEFDVHVPAINYSIFRLKAKNSEEAMDKVKSMKIENLPEIFVMAYMEVLGNEMPKAFVKETVKTEEPKQKEEKGE